MNSAEFDREGPDMQIVVIGSGAMGGLFGARLSAVGHDVVLYDIWEEHVAAIQKRGLIIEGADSTPIRYQVQATSKPPPALRGADLLLVQVKAYDTLKALRPLEPRINPESMILSLQNGLGNLEAMRQALPDHSRILIGTTAQGAGIIAPGRIRHAGPGPTVIGDPDVARTPGLNLTPVRDAFRQAGLETEISDRILQKVWLKLAANVSINPLTAMTGLQNGKLLDDPALLELADAAVAETIAVMRATGLDAPEQDYRGFARQVMRDTASAYSSMLNDIRHGRRTEIDSICGAVAAIGSELGVATPVNRWLTALVKSREQVVRHEGKSGS
jgi:2-dehydropantoate 2-reductase